MEIDSRYHLAAGVKIRREKFGGLAYKHRGGSLHFIHSNLLFQFLQNDGTRTVRQRAEQIRPGVWNEQFLNKILAALKGLQKKGIINEI